MPAKPRVTETRAADAPQQDAAPAPIGYLVTCLRHDRGLWRAGRYWPPGLTLVQPDELSPGQLAAVQAEPMLDVQAITE